MKIQTPAEAIDWILGLATPERPHPSAWTKTDWLNYWRGQRREVLRVIENLRQEPLESALAGDAVDPQVTDQERCPRAGESLHFEHRIAAELRADRAEAALTQLREGLHALEEYEADDHPSMTSKSEMRRGNFPAVKWIRADKLAALLAASDETNK